ncbi:ninjurin C [Arctopsyche grandis]|uniref:ninjurin C n=1 Tax=Arctopsyche grandis TaxID=121162 RepID=UPI00406D8792
MEPKFVRNYTGQSSKEMATDVESSRDGAQISRIAEITIDTVKKIKGLDANRYATKKTIAQGMLDIALLTANASQLKYILQVGEKHEFYTLLLTLITVSIVLQVTAGVLFVVLGSFFDLNKPEDHKKADILNNVCLAINVLIVSVDVIVNVFFMRDDEAKLR